MSGIWHNTYHEPDQAWIITTNSGCIYKRCGSFSDAILTMVSEHTPEPDSWERFCQWQFRSSRRCVGWARIKLSQARMQAKHEQERDAPPPYREFEDEG